MFFAVTAVTYDSFYKRTLLKDNAKVATNWTLSIDNRLNAIYEHLYDLSTTVYNNCEVSFGSPVMDFADKKTILDATNAKVTTTSDITAIFVLDSESDLLLYSSASVLNSEVNNGLKAFISKYALDNSSSINNKNWSIVVPSSAYFYKALKLGKYIIGAVSDLNLHKIELPYDYTYDKLYTYIESDGSIYSINCSSDFIEKINEEKTGNYFTNGSIVITTDLHNADARTFFITRAESVGAVWRITTIFMILDSILCVLLALALIHNTRNRINKPILNLVEANSKLSTGDFDYKLDVTSAGSDEFEKLYGSFNNMSDKIKNLTIEQYDAEIKRQQNQLKMLRAQVKPHTFLNAINTINNMTYTGKSENIRKYIAAFASFTRYMMYKAKDWTTVEDEIKNIDSYVKMQQIRFPESIEIDYDIDPEIYSEQIPYLILFSLVENSFKHAMTLTDKAYITIKGEYYEEEGFKGFRLIEEDNGPGFSKEALEKIINAEADDPFTKEHLGLTNVRYSLNLIYKRDDLLRISNRPEGGAHIELLIPEQEIDDETAGM